MLDGPFDVRVLAGRCGSNLTWNGRAAPECIARGLIFEVRPDLDAVPGGEAPDNARMLIEEATTRLRLKALKSDDQVAGRGNI